MLELCHGEKRCAKANNIRTNVTVYMKSNTGIISGCSESTDSNTSSGIWLHQYSVLMSVLSVYDFI